MLNTNSEVGLVRLIRRMKAGRQIYLQKDINLLQLGTTCKTCEKSIIHCDSVSICRCYRFCHKQCLVKQIQTKNIQRNSQIFCKQCKKQIKVKLDYDLELKFKTTLKDIGVICLLMLIFVLLLVNLNGQESVQEMVNRLKQDEDFSWESLELLTFYDVMIFFLAVLIGCGLWLRLISVCIKIKVHVFEIQTVKAELKISAFIQLQQRINQQSRIQIHFPKNLDIK